jgi:hypothetical protein
MSGGAWCAALNVRGGLAPLSVFAPASMFAEVRPFG